jgi:mannose-1-phosphate guanylyltransferase
VHGRLPPAACRLPIFVRAFLLAAGFGTRFRPVTEAIPKPLLPFMNVPLARAHLQRLKDAGVTEAGVNLHYLADEIEQNLAQIAGELPALRFFREPEILGTAGALANAAGFLSGGDFLVVNSDVAIDVDFAALLSAHKAGRRLATLCVVENREPERYTPLQAEGDRIAAFGADCPDPLLYTGVCALSARALARIPPGHRQLVADLWQPMLDDGLEIGFVRHSGPFSDLGTPRDFLGASLEALERGGPFPRGSGCFDPGRRVLGPDGKPPAGEMASCVLGRAAIGRGARLDRCVVFPGVRVGDEARLSRCLVAGGVVEDGAAHEDALLWPGPDGAIRPHPLG